MSKFLTGFGCGVALTAALAGGVALAQAITFPALSGNRGGLPDGRNFTVVCTDANGRTDNTRRMTAQRPQGNHNSPDVLLQCQ